MFFLGASSHFLLYVLVPAFLTVCLCFGKEPIQPEFVYSFPVEEWCAATIFEVAPGYTVCKEEKKKESNKPDFVSVTFKTGFVSPVLIPVFLTGSSLRAPPF